SERRFLSSPCAGSLSSGGDSGDALEIALDERLVHAPGGLVCEDPPREIELGVDASGCCPLLAESEPTETSRIEPARERFMRPHDLFPRARAGQAEYGEEVLAI